MKCFLGTVQCITLEFSRTFYSFFAYSGQNYVEMMSICGVLKQQRSKLTEDVFTFIFLLYSRLNYWVWWLMSVILALRRVKEAVCHEF